MKKIIRIFTVKTWNKETIYFLLCAILAIAMRFSNIGEQSLWIDEAVHFSAARDLAAGSRTWLSNDNNGLLLSLLLAPFVKLFGMSIIAGRILSALFGLGIVYTTYRLGRLLLTPYAAWLAAFLTAGSPYLIFWSKICRNYTIFSFLYLLGLYLLVLVAQRREKQEASGYLWVGLMAVMMLGFGAHYLFIFFLPGVVLWYILQHTKISYSIRLMSIPVVYVLFTALAAVAGQWVSPDLANWISPQWRHLQALYQADTWGAFKTYTNVLRFDWPWLWIGGLPALFFLRKNHQTFLHLWIVFAAVPLLLLSFWLREPVAQRYIIFVYPLFVLLFAAGIGEIFRALAVKIPSRYLAGADLWAPLLLVLPFARIHELKRLWYFNAPSGHVIDERLSECVFSDWKGSTHFLGGQIQTGDIVLATAPAIPNVYLKRNDVLSFRQLHFDYAQKKYIPNKPAGTEAASAVTTADLVRTVNRYPRGWLLADFNLESVMTDPMARNFIFQYLHFYPEASEDGSVMVFGWDHRKPPPAQQNFVLQVGKTPAKAISRELVIMAPDSLIGRTQLKLYYKTQYVDTGTEAILLLNRQYRCPLPRNRGSNAELGSITLPQGALQRGQNIAQFYYEASPETDKQKGFVVYYLAFSDK